MQLFLIKNQNNAQRVLYKIARIVYAETSANSLRKVEAMSSMIYNIHVKYNKSFEDIAKDENIFEVLSPESTRHKNMDVSVDDKKFQMCLRVVNSMMRGNLPDYVFGATKFHHTDVLPDWARARGYIAEYEDILFYL